MKSFVDFGAHSSLRCTLRSIHSLRNWARSRVGSVNNESTLKTSTQARYVLLQMSGTPSFRGQSWKKQKKKEEEEEAIVVALDIDIA